MLKILCRALGHRLRVVQDFSSFGRRVKCKRCGGDWGMCDALRLMVDWHPDLEQAHRLMGFEILEPLPAWRAFPIEPLTLPELFRAVLWPGALAITLTSIAGHAIEATGVGEVGLIAVYAVSYGTARLLGQRAIERAYARKCNSLRA